MNQLVLGGMNGSRVSVFFVAGLTLLACAMPAAGQPPPDRLNVTVGAVDRSASVLLDHSSFGHEGFDAFELGPEGDTNSTWGLRLFSSPYNVELGWDARPLRSRTEFNLTVQTFNRSNEFTAFSHFAGFTFGRGVGSPHPRHIYLAEIVYSPTNSGATPTTNVVDIRRITGGDNSPFSGAVLLPRLLVSPGTNTVGTIRVFFAPVRLPSSQQVLRDAAGVTVNFVGQRGARHTVSLYRRQLDGSLRLLQRKVVFSPLPLAGESLDSTGPVSVRLNGSFPPDRQVVRVRSGW